MTDDLQRNSLEPKTWIRQNWWLIPSFFVLFGVGGALGWAIFIAQSDIGSNGLHEDGPEMHTFRKEEPRRFLIYGLVTSVAGTSLIVGIQALVRKSRNSKG